MIIPIRTDYRRRKSPLVNYAIVLANVLLYFLGFNASSESSATRIDGLLLNPDNLQLYQFITSVFLHGGIAHLLGNMLFLWVFGGAINDKFGHIGYLAFYLAGGILACLGYIILAGHAPLLGASGAISAVTGAYLVLLPRVRITVIFWMIFIFPMEISSLYFLAIQVIYNVVMSMHDSGGQIAFIAHCSGYAFGIAISAALLAARILPRDPFDLLNLLHHRFRKMEYQKMTRSGFDPFAYQRQAYMRGAATGTGPENMVEVVAIETLDARELELRKEISQAVAAANMPAAAENYIRLMEVNPDSVLPRQTFLDIANHFMANARYSEAAEAYEGLAYHYSSYEHLGDIYLMLGIIHSRYLNLYDKAEEFLQMAMPRLTDGKKLQMAQAELQAARLKQSG